MGENSEESVKLQTQRGGGGNGPPTRPTTLAFESGGFRGKRLPPIGDLKKYQGVVGSMIVGHGGEILASDLPDEQNLDYLGMLALAVHMNSSHVVKKMGQQICHEVVARTSKGFAVIASFTDGLIFTLCNEEQNANGTDVLVPLMKGVTELLSHTFEH